MMPLIRTLLCLMTLLTVMPVLAKDAVTEQYNASVARKHFLEMREAYESATRDVDAQAQRVEQEQAQLNILRQRQQAAKSQLEAADMKLKQRQQALEKAWNN